MVQKPTIGKPTPTPERTAGSKIPEIVLDAFAAGKLKTPNLSNYTPGLLADELGEIKAAISKLEKVAEYLKAGLKAKMATEKVTNVEGQKYEATLIKTQQQRISSDLAREVLPPKTLEKIMTTIDMEQLRTKRID